MDFNGFHQCWFAIQVRPRHEFLTARLLRGKGYEEFVPSYRSRCQWSDRTKEIETPLFAGYVFCRFNEDVRWPIVSTQGVIRVVGTSKGPAPIPEQEIESIRRVLLSGMNPRPCTYLNVGDRVRITGGPLAGVEGTMIMVRNRRQLVLSIELVQGAVVVDIDQCATTSGVPIVLPDGFQGCAATA